MAEQEASLGDFLLELLPCVNLADAVVTEFQSPCIDILLNLVKQVLNPLAQSLNRSSNLLSGITAGNLYCSVRKVARTDGKTYRNSLKLPFSELESGTQGVTVIYLDTVAV